MPTPLLQATTPARQTATIQTPGAATPGTFDVAALPSMSLTALQTQLAQLRVQAAGLDARWQSLQDQLQAMRIDNPSRPAINAEWAQVASAQAQVRGQLAMVGAEIARRTHNDQPVSISVAPPVGQIWNSRDIAAIGAFALFIAIALPLSIAVAKRIMRGGPRLAAPQDLSPRLDRLEHAVDAIAIEIERVSEGQRFMTKIMAERSGAQPVSPAESHDGAPSEPRSPLALGAGPAEQIQMQQRQAVREQR